MVIDVDHGTPEETVLSYVWIVDSHKAKVRIACVAKGRIRCELHGGVVIEAASPEELEEKLK